MMVNYMFDFNKKDIVSADYKTNILSELNVKAEEIVEAEKDAIAEAYKNIPYNIGNNKIVAADQLKESINELLVLHNITTIDADTCASYINNNRQGIGNFSELKKIMDKSILYKGNFKDYDKD